MLLPHWWSLSSLQSRVPTNQLQVTATVVVSQWTLRSRVFGTVTVTPTARWRYHGDRCTLDHNSQPHPLRNRDVYQNTSPCLGQGLASSCIASIVRATPQHDHTCCNQDCSGSVFLNHCEYRQRGATQSLYTCGAWWGRLTEKRWGSMQLAHEWGHR